MQRKIFKFKIISKESNCILSLDYTNLTNEIIRSITKNLIKIEPNEQCKLLFVGKEDCRLTLEDVYNLSSLFQSVVGSGLVWDIIGDYLYTRAKTWTVTCLLTLTLSINEQYTTTIPTIHSIRYGDCKNRHPIWLIPYRWNGNRLAV